jgi:hypothetical protein
MQRPDHAARFIGSVFSVTCVAASLVSLSDMPAIRRRLAILDGRTW